MSSNVIDSFRLDGKVAVLTGGAGLFGRQIVDGLAEAGAHVVMASRGVEKLEAVASEVKARGLEASAMYLDQGDESSIEALHDQATSRFGGVDVLVNNAVLRPMSGWGGDAEEFRRSMAVNVTGVFLMTRVFGDAMAERGRGSIVNVGSIQGVVGPDFALYDGLGMDPAPDYYIHKGGMLQLTRYAAAKLGPHGVRVNTVNPGGFFNDQDPEFVQRYDARTFLGRMANHTDLKGPIVFLASDASAYVTGATLAVDGGYTAK